MHFHWFAVFSIFTSPSFWCIAPHIETSLNDSQTENKCCHFHNKESQIVSLAHHRVIYFQVKSTIVRLRICAQHFLHCTFYNLRFPHGHNRVAEPVSLYLRCCEIILGHHTHIVSLLLWSFKDLYRMCQNPVDTFTPAAGHTVTKDFHGPASEFLTHGTK